MIDPPQMGMMSRTLKLRVLIECIRHSSITIANETLNDDVRGVSRNAKFSQGELRWLAGHIALVDEFDPREIGQVAFTARQQKTN